jgi:hypothetical protein
MSIVSSNYKYEYKSMHLKPMYRLNMTYPHIITTLLFAFESLRAEVLG